MNECSTDILTKKALEAIRREKMLNNGDNIIVALSGGADSVSLLNFFVENREKLEITTLSAAHINHGLRGEESDRDESFVREICKKLNVPLLVLVADIAGEAEAHGEGLEEAGRRIRYEFLSKEAQGKDSCIATAHTLSDSIETLLLNATRGCGLQGLCGIPPVRSITTDKKAVRVIRPLIDCTRAEVEEYCSLKSISYVNDSTNIDTAFSRNRIRGRVLPELRCINSDVEGAFSRLISHVREDASFLNEQAEIALSDAAMQDGYGGYDAKKLALLKPALRMRALTFAVGQVDNITFRRLTERQIKIMDKMLRGKGALTLGNNLEARVSQGRFLVLNEDNINKGKKILDNTEIIPLEIGISCVFYGRIYRPTLLTLDEYEKRKKIHKNLLKNSLNYDKIAGSLILRSRQQGDFFRPAGRGVKKTLKKLLGEEKIPAALRSALPVVCDLDGIVMVGGVGCDERVSIDSCCRRVMVLENV